LSLIIYLSNSKPFKMKNIILFASLLFSFQAFAQVGQPFPPMEVENLKNKMSTLPEGIAGKMGILGLAYSKKAEGDLKSWFQPMYRQFIHKPKTPSLFYVDYNVNVFFIPMFTGAKRAGYQNVMKKMRKSVDPLLHPYVLFYKGKLKEYKEALDFQGKELPHFYIIDEKGEIIHATFGKYTDRKMQEIVDILDARRN
jgi:hypothetical protein